MLNSKVWAGIACAALGLVPVMVAGQAKSADLDKVLHEMDQGAANFKSAQADLRRDLYDSAVKETTTQNGSVYYLRVGSGVQVGMKFVPPAAKIVELKDGTLRLFDPASDHLTTVSLKSNQAQYESFLAIGFGGSGTDLAKQWTVTYMGTEQLNVGGKTVPVAKLDLVAKDPKSRGNFTHITIWVDPVQDVSLKQQFFEPSGDIQTATYSNLRVNKLTKPEIDGYAIKTDKKTTFDNH